MLHRIFMLCLALLIILIPFMNAEANQPNAQQPANPEITIQASSTLPHRQPGRYGVANLTDGDLNSAWCEGKEGDGIGESITFTFREPRKIGRIGIVVGYAKSGNVFRSNNRVEAVTVTMPNRDLVKLSLWDEPKMQFLEIPPGKAVRSMKITIDKVFRGEKYRDTCLSEIKADPAMTMTVGDLLWELEPKSNSMTWSEAEKYCGDLTIGGFSDWRLPKIYELKSLIRGCDGREKCGNSAASEQSCEGCPENMGPDGGCYWPDGLLGTCSLYWSTDLCAWDNSPAWYVEYRTGYVVYQDRVNVAYARCVRGEN